MPHLEESMELSRKSLQEELQANLKIYNNGYRSEEILDKINGLAAKIVKDPQALAMILHHNKN